MSEGGDTDLIYELCVIAFHGGHQWTAGVATTGVHIIPATGTYLGLEVELQV